MEGKTKRVKKKKLNSGTEGEDDHSLLSYNLLVGNYSYKFTVLVD